MTEANTAANSIFDEYGKDIANVVASDEVRTVETATPLAELLSISTPVESLSGLNEIPAGAFEGAQTNSLEGILYLLGPLTWALGLPLVPALGDPSVNGVTFDEAFSGAVTTFTEGPT